MFDFIRGLYPYVSGETARGIFFIAAVLAALAILFSRIRQNLVSRIYGFMASVCVAAGVVLDYVIPGGYIWEILSPAFLIFFCYISFFRTAGEKLPVSEGGAPGHGPALGFLGVAAVLFIIAALIRTAWVCDDSYITMRTADNFINGYGLRWNTGERVQAYTHPLWMFAVTGLYYFIRDPFFSLILLGWLFTFAGLFVLGITIKDRVKLVFVLVLIALSKAFIDYSTSGLENPMLNLFVVLFFAVYMGEGASAKKIFLLSFITSLAMLTRHDSVLLFIVPLGFTLYENKKLSGIFACAAGFIPLACWEIFSMIYYGFPVPNTFYAKMARGYSIFKYIGSGMYYFFDFVRFDFLSAAVIFAGIIIPFIPSGKNPESKKSAMISVGILLYLLYYIRIGGDFMQGRFFFVPFFAAALVLTRQPWFFKPGIFIRVVLLAFMLAMASGPYSFIRDAFEKNANTVATAREFWRDLSSLEKVLKDGNTKMLNNHFVVSALKWKKESKSARQVHSMHALGYAGYFSGPQVHIVDRLGLSDAFLARQKGMFFEKIGHIYRNLPDGYMETLKGGQNVISDPKLASYYDRMSLVISGRLFDAERLKTIIKMNTGQYDYLLKNADAVKDVK